MSIKKLKTMIKECNNIIFFGGAGISTESGIPDFRSANGIYADKTTFFPPEQILSHNFFFNHTKEFYSFYFDKMIAPQAKPNAAHNCLAQLEKIGKLVAVITQNIDGLHQKAGSKNVLELHGNVLKYECTNCKMHYDLMYALHYGDKCKIPICKICNHIIKPCVVLYGESLDENIVEQSVQSIRTADMCIIGGTSLTVYPAAGFIQYFNGKYLVIINKSETSYDGKADLCINKSIGDVFNGILEGYN